VIKVLWLCNIVLPDFCQEFSIKRVNTGGWMTGMLHMLETKKEVDISLCFPIYDINRLHDGVYNGHRYYTFLCDSIEIYSSAMIESFERILEKNCPDVVHIWGTEFPHTTAMLLACKNRGLLNRTVIHIQGLISVLTKHYRSGIPDKFWTLKNETGSSLADSMIIRENRGKCEIESIKMARNVIGRTDWDRACIEAVNPQIQYYFCDEILRDIFYEYAGKWRYEACRKHSVFVSQASFPIKGFHYLLQALPIVVRKYPDTHVYISGTDILNVEPKIPYAIYIEKLIEELRLDDVITFLGNSDESQMVEQYLKANVFVVASTIENSPNSLNEAMILGVPSIAAYVGGIGNRMSAGSDGFLYPYDEPNLLAYYIGKVFENENGLCERFSDNAVNKMRQFTDPQENADKTMRIYEKISGYDM